MIVDGSSSTTLASAPDPELAVDSGTAAEAPTRWRSPLAWVLAVPIRLYRLTGPLRQPRCRFHPSCSSYALQAVRVHGGLRGGWLSVRRLLRCHPWNPGGVDHVPPRSPR